MPKLGSILIPAILYSVMTLASSLIGNDQTPLSVAVIGCGPSAMSLLHAIQLRKDKLNPNSTEYKSLPDVTCFEKGSGPGGIWKDVPGGDAERNQRGNEILMYEDLWLNGPKEVMEYFDYTWDEHFKKQTPPYLPRQDILEYVIARNGQNNAFRNAKYHHTVLHAKYNPQTSLFAVTIRDETTNTITTQHFDRCIWAAGQNGEPNRPRELMDFLRRGNPAVPSGGFNGTYYHAAHATDRFENDVKGKNLLLIGSSSSAEDLALRAIKYEANHVYITTRNMDGDATQTGSWPKDKVTIVRGVPKQVLKGNVFLWWEDDDDDDKEYDSDDDDYVEDREVRVVEGIDTVVLCTGYQRNTMMLDEELRHSPDTTWSVRDGWTMPKNAFTEIIGDVSPSNNLVRGYVNYPDLYNGLLISNPKMMYLIGPKIDDAPLFSLDLYAWVVLAYLVGDVPIPSHDEMIKANQDLLEEELQIHDSRYLMDENYRTHVRKFHEENDEHWLFDSSSENRDNNNNEKVSQQQMNFAEYEVGCFARYMRLANYPVDFGTYSNLNAIGRRFVDIVKDSGIVRYDLKQNESKNLTFRDTLTRSFCSVHTMTPSIPFPAAWLYLRADDGVQTKLDNLRDTSCVITQAINETSNLSNNPILGNRTASADDVCFDL